MPEQRFHEPRRRIHSHMTRSTFFHIEDAFGLKPPKLRVFAGQYKSGDGATGTAYHFIDLADARVLFSDLAAGRQTVFEDFKGSPGGSGRDPQSRVLRVKTKTDGKVWWELANGPGKVVGQGIIQPNGHPTSVVNVPFTRHESRRLAFAVLHYLRAWEAKCLLDRTPREPQTLTYADGTLADRGNLVEQETYRCYVESHDGKPPLSREVLRVWWQRGNGEHAEEGTEQEEA